MVDLIIFTFGTLVSLVVASAVALLLLGAYQDGKRQEEVEESQRKSEQSTKASRPSALAEYSIN